MKLIVDSKGDTFIPSFPPDYSTAQAYADCLLCKSGWYFKRVVLKRFLFWKRWVETGEVWEPKDGKGWNVIEI